MGGYVIPKNLQNEKDAYIFSFANRTKRNLEFIQEIARKEADSGMDGKDATVFEVTQLINSMIGLVTFPKEAFYDKALDRGNGQSASEYLNELICNIKKNPVDFEYQNTYLCKLGEIKDSGKKRNSYSRNRYEKLNVLNFIRHFRNALSHERLSVYPYNSKDTEEIKGFIFEDERDIYVVDAGNFYIEKSGKQSTKCIQQFRIKLTVEQIEKIAMDICDMLLAVAKDTYGINEEFDSFY